MQQAVNYTSFIETQFPVARLSAEAYKERKAGAGQTLTALGKWWGRKPLVLARAVLLGLLMPASEDPVRDREVFLALMTMDDEGLWRRKQATIPAATLLEHLSQLPPSVRRRFASETADGGLALRPLTPPEREELQRTVFATLPYSERLRYCRRPEQIDGPSPEAWASINAHLGTQASDLSELVQELGRRRFGHLPRVGDAFCGGGSIPFEAARLGCEAYGSDLNPVAALLTWAALNIVGAGEEVARQVQEAQEAIFGAVDAQITAWGIEHNSRGWRADAYLYCTEVVCPECGWRVPLAPSWVIGEKTRVVAELVPEEAGRCFRLEIHEGVSAARLERARGAGTVRDSRLHCPHCGQSTPVEALRRNLRLWENEDLVPRPGDVFQERLYCIRWVESCYERRPGGGLLAAADARRLPGFEVLVAEGRLVERTRRHYAAPDEEDLAREERVLALLRERFEGWQARGCLPSRRIEPGEETTRLLRERGWTHWHHLFTPRQLVTLASYAAAITSHERAKYLLPLVGKLADNNSRLCQWKVSQAEVGGRPVHTFANQALNTLFNYASRQNQSYLTLFLQPGKDPIAGSTDHTVTALAAREVSRASDLWITDPPYADAVNYHELSEFFLAWYDGALMRLFPDWYDDSKRALAIRGSDPATFRRSMVEAYRNLAAHMPDDGMQVVMFTHQDAAVWADLTLILWAAGLRVTAAWTIATETDSALKQGNYVQGTVLMVCRKRTAAEPVFLYELMPLIESEVRRQVQAMQALDDPSEPNFSDLDIQLAGYAAALRVLTAQPIYELDVERELNAPRRPGEVSPIEKAIVAARTVATEYVCPRALARDLWRVLTPMERLYLKGLEMESQGERRTGSYQELARGLGATDYTALLASRTANEARVRTPAELGSRLLGGEGFGSSPLRQVLFALWQAEKSEDVRAGLSYLKTELGATFWERRRILIGLLRYIARFRLVADMGHWRSPAERAELLAGLLENEGL